MPENNEPLPPDIHRREALRRVGSAAVGVALAASGLSRLPLWAEARPEVSLRIACDGCGLCEPCPYGVAIRQCFGYYNAAVADGTLPDPRRRRRRQSLRFLSGYRNAIDQFGQADRCIGCRRCEALCPHKLPVVAHLRQIEALTERLMTDELRRR